MSTARPLQGGDYPSPGPRLDVLRFPVADVAPAEMPTRSTAPEHFPHIFGASACLLGVALSAFGLFSILSHARSIINMGEELLAINACFFAISCSIAFLTMRIPNHRWRGVFGVVAEVVFLVGLTMMALICMFLVVSIRMHK